MHRRRRSSKNAQTTRFSLLLLEDGEYFLDVCTRGLFFVPQELLQPVLRFPFRCMTAEPVAECFLDGLNDFKDPPRMYLTFTTSLVIEMRERGIDHPYVFKDTTAGVVVGEDTNALGSSRSGSSSSLNADTPSKYVFTLLHSTLESFLASLHVSYEVANLPRRMLTKREEETLLAPVLGPRLATEFDPSLLVDFREKPLLETGQPADRIEPLLKYPGCLMLTDSRLYFQPAPLNNVLDPVLNWEYSTVAQIYKRRYLLQQTGLEIALRNGESFFFSLRSVKERDAFYMLMVQQPELRRCQRTDLRLMMRKWQRRELSNFEYLLFLNNASGRTRNDLTQYPVFPWVLCDYRSAELDLSDPKVYRDLTKPIGALDAERLAYFRTRYEVMPRGEEAEGMPPPFLYGTHYSTPGYVLYYLVRMAPQCMLCLQSGKFDAPDRLFRSIAVTWDGCVSNYTDVKELIPEFFDCGFPADEWLRNAKHLDLGATQSFSRVDDVELPPWAHGDANEFVRKNRAALESDFVSEHLHHWIDLIFGYKQQGDEAVKADNLFYYLSYEGSVDLETIDDPVQKCSLESQIQEFGQTPKLLFSSPHPSRNENEGKLQVATLDLLPSPRVYLPQVRRVSYPPDGVLNLRHRRRNEVAMSQFAAEDSDYESEMEGQGDGDSQRQRTRRGYSFLCFQPPWQRFPLVIEGLSAQLWGNSGAGKPLKTWEWRSRLRTKYSLSSSWVWKQTSSSQLHSGEITSAVLSGDGSTLFTTCKDSALKRSATESGAELSEIVGQSALSCCDLSPDERTVFVGCWDNRVYMYSVATGRVLHKLFAHSDGISAIRVLKDRVFTSSWDSTVKLWRYTSSFMVASPIRTFLNCEEAVLCLDVSRDGQWGAAGTRNGVVYLFDLTAVEFHSQVAASPLRRGDVSSVAFASDAKTYVCVTMESELLQFSLRGEQLWRMDITIAGQIRCFDSDGEYAVGGTTTGKILIWKLHEEAGKELVYHIPQAHETIVSALAVSSTGSTIVSGDVDGFVKVWKLRQSPFMAKKRPTSAGGREATAQSVGIQTVEEEKPSRRSKKKKKRRGKRPPRQQPAFYVPGLASQVAEAQCCVEF
ncbi:hypothetical protein BBJ28_00015774 [Nothophytophthora sp. Chile5]|nr:hypothetical protein BBJ28_00015774 [Nothophytophthora sp. Chile5]